MPADRPGRQPPPRPSPRIILRWPRNVTAGQAALAIGSRIATHSTWWVIVYTSRGCTMRRTAGQERFTRP
ncbi:hypothetical protein SSAG_04080 [Streptomyces sp. Mg1]|nr:hypothetical protein SSAG_04080 [Streptomyces sp. Mg1]